MALLGLNCGNLMKCQKKMLNYVLPYINFDVRCLIKNNISIPKKVINLYTFYTVDPQLRNLNTDFTLGNCLFGSVKLTKNTDRDKYNYSGYGTGFDSCSFRIFIT